MWSALCHWWCMWAVNQLLNEDTAVFYTPYYPYGNLRLGKVPIRPVRGEGRGTERVRQKRAVTHLVMATLTVLGRPDQHLVPL